MPAVYIDKGYLVVADLHLGYEEAMSRDGVYLPRVQLQNALKLLRRLSELGVPRLVIAGDIKHAFDRLLKSERLEVSRFLSEATSVFREVIVLRGNHDNYVSGVVRDSGAEFVDADMLDIGGITVAHGHKMLKDRGDIVVMGHEHPAVQVRVGGSRVKFPVILKVPLEGGGVVVVAPPAGTYQTGNVVTTSRESYLSPLIREEGLVEAAIPYIIDEPAGVMELARLDLLERVLS